MSDETTQYMNGRRSFEERVFARFDALDSTLKDLDARLQKLEVKSHNTKPIWERVLAEILTMSQKLDTVERKLNVLRTANKMSRGSGHFSVENSGC